MAKAELNWAGLVITLDHDEVGKVFGTADEANVVFASVIGALTALGGIPGVAAGAIVAAVKAYLEVQKFLIKRMDQGAGVYLTIPYTALLAAQWWVIIPTPVPLPPPPWDADWTAGLDDGHLKTEDEDDDIHFIFEHNAVGPEIVLFKLVNPTSSDKKINMPDGGGSSWDIEASDGGGEADNALEAHQVHNGQQLTFSNHIAFGFWDDVLWLGNLGRCQPGDRVTFIWERD